MAKIIYVDMDGVLADFEASDYFHDNADLQSQVYKMYSPGFFLDLKPIPGALTSVRALMRMGYDVHVLSRPVAESAHSYSEKAQWISLWFPELIFKLHLSQDKGLFKGDYLIDDDEDRWRDSFEANGGKFVHFSSTKNDDHAAMWEKIVEFFRLAQESK